MILVLTSKQDVHADEVIRRLTKRGLPVFRLNTEDSLTKYKFELSLEPSGAWQGLCVNETGRQLVLQDVRVAWYRKPNFSFDYEFGIDDGARAFAVSEVKSFFEILYSLPGIKWINPPHAADQAKSKFPQLLLAAASGIRVPRTLITTDPVAAASFFRACGESVLAKAIYTSNATIEGRSRGLPSVRVGPDQFYGLLDSVRVAPVQLQEYVEKQYEVRVTVFGDRVLAVRIDSQANEETKIDWRVHADLNSYSSIELPGHVSEFCRRLLLSQGLSYGAMDFIVTPANQHVFLENNPFGQYLWLELEVGIELSEAMCELLQRYA